jgi:hypothetical protein
MLYPVSPRPVTGFTRTSASREAPTHGCICMLFAVLASRNGSAGRLATTRRSQIATLVERQTRYVMMAKVDSST